MKKYYIVWGLLICLLGEVRGSLVSDFNIAQTSGCCPLPILAFPIDTSSSPVIARRWFVYGPGPVNCNFVSPAGPNPALSFITCCPGNYCIRLWTQNQQGDTCSVTKCNVTVYPSPSFINPSITPGSSCTLPVQVTLHTGVGTAPGLHDTLMVDWGCQSLSFDSIPPDSIHHTYSNLCLPGCYSPTLILRNEFGCMADTTLVNAVCFGQPIASGFVSVDEIPCPNPPAFVSFTSTSQFADSLIWHFGDGMAETGAATSHFYFHPGCYEVNLIACNGSCCDTAIIDTICVLGPRVISAVISDSSICACKDSVEFTVGIAYTTSVSFVFGCNQGFTTIDSIVSGTDANPTYLTFRVPYCLLDSCRAQLILGNDSGCSVLYEFPFIKIDSPLIDFLFDNYEVCGQGNVCFHDQTYYAIAPDSTITQLWDFGDGSALSNIFNPCHFYAQPGNYAVKFKITTAFGCTDSIMKWVVVSDFPTAYSLNFESSIFCGTNTICLNDSVLYYPLANAGTSIWNFGDGVIDTAFNPCHAYSSSGNYEVTVHTRDNYGCLVSDTVSVAVVSDPLQAGFTYTQTGDTIQFTNTSSGNYQTVLWNFGDGASSGQVNPEHIYSAADTFTVTLTTTDNTGPCSDDTSVQIVILPTITSIQYDAENLIRVTIVPNPFSDFTTIQISGSENDYDFRLYNLIGEEMLIRKLSSGESLRLSGAALAKGIYQFEIAAAQKVFKRGKLIVK